MNRTHIGLGLFVVGTIGLLLWLAQSIGALGGARGDRYEVRLQHAAGLVENNAVKIAGVQVGRIEKIGVDHDTAVLTLLVDNDIVLHQDARAVVRAKSLLGEKYLQLQPGTVDGPVLEPGSRIEHVETPFEIDQVLNALEPILGGEESIAAVVAPLVATLNEMLSDAAGKNGAPAIITREELEKMIDDVEATTASVRRMTEENEEKIGNIVDHSERLLGDPRVGRIIGRVDSMTETLDERLPGLLDRTEQALERTQTALDKLEKLAAIVDDDRSQKIKRIIDDAAVATANLKKISKELEDVGSVFKPLLSDLKTIADRASAIDGELIRQFLQKEGVKIFVGGRRDAQKALGE